MNHMNGTNDAAHPSEAGKGGTGGRERRSGRILWIVAVLALVGGLSGNYLGSGTKECTVTGGYTTISNKRGSGMEDEGRTIETEQCGELRWGARDVGSDGMTAEELDAKHPELVQGETYVFHMQGFHVPVLAKPSIVGVEEA